MINPCHLKERRHSKKSGSSDHAQVIVIVERSGESDKLSLSSRLSEEIERAQRYQHFLSLVILAIDSSSKKPLKEITQFLKKNTRKVDFLFLYKKEKLVFLLPETSREGALSLTWRLKREIEFHSFLGKTKTSNKVRLGIACYPTEASSGEELLEKAFLSLKEDKRSLRRRDAPCEQSPTPVEN